MGRRLLLLALCVGLNALWVSGAEAATLLTLSGHVGLADGTSPEGTKLTLQLDLDRDGKFGKFETATGTVPASGAFKIKYSLDASDVSLDKIAFVEKLLKAYASNGFSALLSEGPLTVLLTVQRPGYSTVARRFSALGDGPALDFMLAALKPVNCGADGCLAADGSVTVDNLPDGFDVEKMYAQAFDPGKDARHFPGAFADDQNKLLISSGFAELNAYDADGKELHDLPAPIAVRFEANPASFPTTRDLKANSGRIEVPMFSFSRDSGQWVSEADGELQLADGTPVKESELASIVAGTFKERVFIAFSTSHLSYFNCDHEISGRACVKGRLLGEGKKPVAAVTVAVNGVSYEGNAGEVFTGVDGTFAVDVLRSEQAGEDLDYNGMAGETFTAHVSAEGIAGSFVGASFDTPSAQGSVQASGVASCLPAACKCKDLGDIQTAFEPPRPCEISLQASYSGENLEGSEGPLMKGDPLANASVSFDIAGSGDLSKLCGGATHCAHGKADAQGKVTITVPVVGDAADLSVNVDLSLDDGDYVNSYSANVSVKGCAKGEAKVSAVAMVETPHTRLKPLANYIEELFGGAGGGGGGGGSSNNPLKKSAANCGCHVVAKKERGQPYGAYGLVLTGLVLAVRRRRR